MWELLELLLIVPALAGGLAALSRILGGRRVVMNALGHNRRRVRRWGAVLAAHGLEVETISSYEVKALTLMARKGSLVVRCEHSRKLGYTLRVEAVVAEHPDFSDVRIRRAPRNLPPWAQEIEIGDPTFDRMFFVSGPMRLICALLNAETRDLLVRMNAEHHLEIGGGELWAETNDAQLPSLLPHLLELSQRFSQPFDIALHLAKNARLDPAPGVRLQNLLLLVRESPGDPRATEALRRACSDSSPEIRLRAAMELGTEGRVVLVELAMGDVGDDCGARAVSALGRELPFDRMRAILATALHRRQFWTARACLEALGHSGTVAAVNTLAEVMAREKSELAVAAARALGTSGSREAEPALIKALERGQWDLRVAAATALGGVGTAAAVLPLKQLDRLGSAPEIRRATRQAIAEIQYRLEGASPGQLSLVGAEAGQLSLTQAETGQLSLAGEQAGQLSLPVPHLPEGEEGEKPPGSAGILPADGSGE